MPANIPSDSVSAGNKCPSFTVCWLIYTNYRSLCSREDDQIVWDESIKSLLSQAIISRYLAAVIRSAAGWAWWETWASCMHAFFDTHTHTLWDKGCYQPNLLLKLSSSHPNYLNHSILTKNADSRAELTHAHTGPYTRRWAHAHMGGDTHSRKLAPRVLSDFRELNSHRWQTNSPSPVKKPLFGQIVCMTSPTLQQMGISTVTWSSPSHLHSCYSSIPSTHATNFIHSWSNSVSEKSMEVT